MEERSNKTIMCSVLFLDIVEYSKRSVAGQISLKDRFNSYLSAAISNVPIEDRIILDTGDGAAINFLGDVEDALKAALSLRESILNEGPNQDPPLLVRAGINLGPVRLVRDINGQPNIVGDGINVAQRIMGFADADQIFVSRSYYDAVSRLSPLYAGLFAYQGSHTDKHVREHEIYAIGHLGEKTSEMIAQNLRELQKGSWTERLTAFVSGGWNGLVLGYNNATGQLKTRLAQANPRQRALYAGAAAVVPVVLVGMLLFEPAQNDEAPAQPDAGQEQAASNVEPVSAVASAAVSTTASTVAPAAPAAAAATGKTKEAVKPAPPAKPDTKNAAEDALATKKSEPAKPHVARESVMVQIKIAVVPWGEVYLDDRMQGVSPPLSELRVTQGQHKIEIRNTTFPAYIQNIHVNAGDEIKIKHKFTN